MHVVVVEPSRIGAKMLARMMQDCVQQVTAFSDGGDALAFIAENDGVDVVLTSLEVPTRCGLEICWEVGYLSMHERPIYLIAMSSSQEEGKLVEALDSGANDFIRKPPSLLELKARLRAAERQLRYRRELVRLANIDPLTGLYNRRAFFAKAEAACDRARHGGSLCAIMFDIDHFKRVNDVHGHDVGDVAIKAVASIAGDGAGLAGRLGGEEFAILLEDCSEAEASAVADSHRRQIGDLQIPTATGMLNLTCSFGVSSWRDGDDIDKMLKRADTALYQAKSSGRNCVVIYSGEAEREVA